MFQRDEIKRNLWGCLDVALLMPSARDRFGDNYDEALRSFAVPALMFPVTLLSVQLFPPEALADHSSNTIALLYSLRFAIGWALYLGCIYWLTKKVDRKKHFCQFVIASNWLSVPATLIFLPPLWMVITGASTIGEVSAIMTVLVVYTYIFTGYMAANVLRIPWELAGFIAIIGMYIDNYIGDLFNAVAQIL